MFEVSFIQIHALAYTRDETYKVTYGVTRSNPVEAVNKFNNKLYVCNVVEATDKFRHYVICFIMNNKSNKLMSLNNIHIK